MEWSFYKNNVYLEPLVFSNKKSQLDVAKEVIKAIKENHKVIFIKGVCGSGKCLSENTLVFCKPDKKDYFGYYKISDLEGKRGEILSLNKKGKIIQTEFKNVRKTGKKSIYSLKTRTGREILASANHPLLTITEKGVEWKKLEELTNKDYICLPNHISMNKPLFLEDEKIKILAHLISEGKLGDKAGSPKYYQNKYINPKIRRDYEETLNKLFPDGEIRNKHKTEVTIVFNNMNTRFGTTNKLRLFIREFGLDGKKSKDKFVPRIIFNLSEEKISLFLRTLFSGDGSIYSRKLASRNRNFVVEYSSISKRLIQDTSLLMNRLGIQHTISSKKFRENTEYCYKITISNQPQIKKFIEKVGFIGEKQEIALKILPKLKDHKFTNIDKIPRIIRKYLKEKGYSYGELDRFLNYEEILKERENKIFKEIRLDKKINTPRVFGQKNIDFLRSHLNEINKYIKDALISFVCSKDIIWDKIKQIKYIKNSETYDLEVKENHNFIANGIIVHNSAIALNIAKEFKKTSIVVPVKTLQNQYREDYTNNFQIKKNGKNLKITVIDGRNNHKCPYKNTNCDDKELPCTIDIKEDNMPILKEYLEQNILLEEIRGIKDIRRKSIATACPYWSPIIPKDVKYNLDGAKEVEYDAINNKKFICYKRKPGCSYYDQFDSYIDSDVIIFNSKKYELETVMDRKPATDIEIIDECDEFLDKLSAEKEINLNRLSLRLSNIQNPKIKELILEVNDLILQIKYTEEILLIKDTKVLNLLNYFLKNINLFEDDEDYLYNIYETAKSFENFFNETYVSFKKNKYNELIATITTINLEKRLKEYLNKNKVFIMMSGTIHSENVLKNIFGIKDFKIIEAETNLKGNLIKKKTGLERTFNYEFLSQKGSRELYLNSLSKSIELAKKPILIHVNSFSDLPDEYEFSKYKLNIKTRERLMEEQNKYRKGELLQAFKNKEIDTFYSTKCSRGVDLPGDICNSIVFTKYPYPNIHSLFWKVLKKSKPQNFGMFYFDKARRELIQRVYRGIRSEKDEVNLLSPDIRVFDINS